MAVRLVHLFRNREETFDDLDDFRANAGKGFDQSLAPVIARVADACEAGTSIATYEWLLGAKVSVEDDGE